MDDYNFWDDRTHEEYYCPLADGGVCRVPYQDCDRCADNKEFETDGGN